MHVGQGFRWAIDNDAWQARVDSLKHVFEGLENIKNKAAEVVIRRKEEDNMVDIETGKVTIPNIKHFFNDS